MTLGVKKTLVAIVLFAVSAAMVYGTWLAVEAFDLRCRRTGSASEDFERDFAIERDLAGEPDDARAALAEFAYKLVVAQRGRLLDQRCEEFGARLTSQHSPQLVSHVTIVATSFRDDALTFLGGTRVKRRIERGAQPFESFGHGARRSASQWRANSQ